MKRFFFLAALTPWLWAGAQLSSAQMGELNRYNHRASIGFADKAALKRFARIDRDEALAIARKMCGVRHPGHITLKRRGRTLYYYLHTPEGPIKINALDGSVIRCAGEKR